MIPVFHTIFISPLIIRQNKEMDFIHLAAMCLLWFDAVTMQVLSLASRGRKLNIFAQIHKSPTPWLSSGIVKLVLLIQISIHCYMWYDHVGR